MVDVSIKSLADELGFSVKKLIIFFCKLGFLKNINDSITKEEKICLLNYLKKENNSFQEPLTLQRKIRSVLNVLGNGGKNKVIPIEIRKKRTYFKEHIDSKKNNKKTVNINIKDKDDNSINTRDKTITIIKKNTAGLNDKKTCNVIEKKNRH